MPAKFRGIWDGDTVPAPHTVTVTLDANIGEIVLDDTGGNRPVVLTTAKNTDGATVTIDAAARSAVYGTNKNKEGFAVLGRQSRFGREGFPWRSSNSSG